MRDVNYIVMRNINYILIVLCTLIIVYELFIKSDGKQNENQNLFKQMFYTTCNDVNPSHYKTYYT